MAKELVFKLSGKDYNAAPVKLERKKIYGWTATIATDRNGDVCSSAYLSPVRQTTYGFFDKDHEKDYNRFQSVFHHSAWYPEQKISLLSLQPILATLLTE